VFRAAESALVTQTSGQRIGLTGEVTSFHLGSGLQLYFHS